jgi:hypothetical protein
MQAPSISHRLDESSYMTENSPQQIYSTSDNIGSSQRISYYSNVQNQGQPIIQQPVPSQNRQMPNFQLLQNQHLGFEVSGVGAMHSGYSQREIPQQYNLNSNSFSNYEHFPSKF